MQRKKPRNYRMENERVEMRFMNDPIDLCRVYMFKVRVSRVRLLNKYCALWYIYKYLWKVVRYGT